MSKTFSSSKSGATDAVDIVYDNSGSSIVSDNAQGAIDELDTRSVFLRQKALTSDFTVLAGYFAFWRDLVVPSTVNLTLEATGDFAVIT